MNTWEVGDMVRLTATFTDSGGTGVDPSSVALTYRQYQADSNSGTTLVYGVNSIVRVAAGIFYHDLAVNSGGEWRYRWAGTGVNRAAVEGQFLVRWQSV